MSGLEVAQEKMDGQIVLQFILCRVQYKVYKKSSLVSGDT
jgi:hypothetical protein